jgi:hypothetical protein
MKLGVLRTRENEDGVVSPAALLFPERQDRNVTKTSYILTAPFGLKAGACIKASAFFIAIHETIQNTYNIRTHKNLVII